VKSFMIGVGSLATAVSLWPQGELRAAPQAPATPTIAASAGTYELDPNHSSLYFRVNHLQLSNYVARFTRCRVTLDLHPDNLAGSSVTAVIDPASIRTDFSGDYHAAVKDSPYNDFDEDLARNPRFFNVDKFPEATFRSRQVSSTGPASLRIVGDLTMLGQTHPVTLSATLVGSTAQHPFAGGPAVGFSATGSFKRSDFGMTWLTQPPLPVGDTVTIQFEGEFRKSAAPIPAEH
jgi:polyisoprenoid-binding protein YceI